MTREEASMHLEKAMPYIAEDYIDDVVMACEIAINALQAEPVKHGEWINIFDNTWECTNCETCEQFAYNIESTSDYCPNCGAKMDKEKEDDK